MDERVKSDVEMENKNYKRLNLFLSKQVNQLGIALYFIAGGVFGHNKYYCDKYHQQQNIKTTVTGSFAIGFQRFVTSFF